MSYRRNVHLTQLLTFNLLISTLLYCFRHRRKFSIRRRERRLKRDVLLGHRSVTPPSTLCSREPRGVFDSAIPSRHPKSTHQYTFTSSLILEAAILLTIYRTLNPKTLFLNFYFPHVNQKALSFIQGSSTTLSRFMINFPHLTQEK